MRCEQLVESQKHSEFALPCGKDATYELHGIKMCPEHYIEALEHGAQFDFGEWDGLDKKVWMEGRVKVKT